MNPQFDRIIYLYQELPETKGDPFRIIRYNVAHSNLRDAVSALTDEQCKAFATTHGEPAERALRIANAVFPTRGW